MISTLIDKQDNFEIIRDQIGAILLTEIANQQVLAAAADQDPALYKLRVFSERSDAWEQFLNPRVNEFDTGTPDLSPIVNIWFDSDNFDPKASNVSESQKADGVFNIDCYGYGLSSNNPAGGHNPGDREAALQAHKALRLVRNILMAAEYTYLDLRGLVWNRWTRTRTSFQPQQGDTPIQNIWGARLALSVGYSEFSPQITPVTLNYVAIDVTRAEDGQLLLETDFDYTAP